MNTSGEAAEQVMRMSLEGAEILIKLTGSGAKNAAVLAVQMLALSDEELSAKLEKSKKDMIDGVIAKNEKLQKMVDEL